MMLYPAVIVHGMEDVCTALRPRLPVLLLSAPAAAVFAGCGFWLALIGLARENFPAATFQDALDCADAPGIALAAIRAGQRTLILRTDAPGFAAVAAIAAENGLCLFGEPPPALDLAWRGAARKLSAWLAQPPANIDSAARLR